MNTRQQKFVTEYLQWGIPCLAYANAYNKPNPNGRAIESAANRLLRNPEVKQAIHDAEDRIRHQVEREIADRQALDVFTIEQKRHLLKQIATGDMLVEQRYKTGDCRHCTQFVRPTINQMLRAIDLDNRMAAHYPPPQQTKTGKISLPGIYPADSGRGIGGQPTPDTREQQQNTTTNTCPPQAGVSRSDGGGTLASDPREQQNTTTEQEVPPLNLAERSHEPTRVTQEVPCEYRAEDVHSRRAKNTSPEQQHFATTETCPPLPVPTVSGAEVSAAADGGGTLAPDTREQQQNTTTERSELIATTKKDIDPAITNTDNTSPLQGDLGVHSRGTQNTLPEISLPPSERQPERFILAGLGRAGFRGIGGQTTPDTREEQQKTTSNNTTENTTTETRLPGIYPADSGRGIGGQPAPDAREQQNTTTERSELIATTKKDINPAITNTDNITPAFIPQTAGGAGGNIAQDTPVELTTTDNKMQQSTITHYELMELLYPKEEKLQSHTFGTTIDNNSA